MWGLDVSWNGKRRWVCVTQLSAILLGFQLGNWGFLGINIPSILPIPFGDVLEICNHLMWVFSPGISMQQIVPGGHFRSHPAPLYTYISCTVPLTIENAPQEQISPLLFSIKPRWTQQKTEVKDDRGKKWDSFLGFDSYARVRCSALEPELDVDTQSPLIETLINSWPAHSV